MVVKVKAKPVDMVIVQAYLPTTDYEDEVVEKLYDQLEEILGKQKRKTTLLLWGILIQWLEKVKRIEW